MTIAQEHQIQKLQERLEDTEAVKIIKPFAAELGEAIATILASTPYEKWPSIGKTAFQHLARRQAVTAEIYKNRLPK